jgi:hypothetical protein
MAVAASGCVRVYQPLSGLHDPRIVDPKAQNFRDLRLEVYCVPGDYLGPSESSALCRRVGTLFENQGATVETYIRPRGQIEDAAVSLGSPAGEAEETGPKTDLILELRSEQLEVGLHPLSWVLCSLTFTLVPGVTESTFRQDVVIRDGSGFLLATQTLEGRLVRSFGGGVWAGNKLLDLTVREDSEELTGDGAGRDLSADLYGQLSQTMFNAKLRWEVLKEAPTAAGRPAP